MEQTVPHVIYLDDYHAGDVHFLQSLARGLARKKGRPAPAIVHGSAEHAERLLEANGIFRTREQGILQIETQEEHSLVERATRQLNQKIVGILSDAVVSSVGVFGTQRRALTVHEQEVVASGGAWIYDVMKQGIVPVLASYGRHEKAGTVGEVPTVDAVIALARALGAAAAEVVFFTKTNLPGIMAEGRPIPDVALDHPALGKAVADMEGLRRVAKEGLSILITNTARFADSGAVGSRITTGVS